MIHHIQIVIGVLLAAFTGPLFCAKILAEVFSKEKEELINATLILFACGVAIAVSGLISMFS